MIPNLTPAPLGEAEGGILIILPVKINILVVIIVSDLSVIIVGDIWSKYIERTSYILVNTDIDLLTRFTFGHGRPDEVNP